LALLALAAPTPARAEQVPLPGLRVVGGPVWHASPERDVIGALDILPVITVYDLGDSGFAWGFLLGYGYESDRTHLFEAGGEIGYSAGSIQTSMLGFRGVVGSSSGNFGIGFRATAGAEFLLGLFRVEFAFQLVHTDGHDEKDVRLTAGVDVLRLPFLAFAFAGHD
ncbi:MAG: hypothetical protein KC635_19545, partial [Myxococcales bacterium]|nr:hypothetical protein [Myxococcales bacterium]